MTNNIPNWKQVHTPSQIKYGGKIMILHRIQKVIDILILLHKGICRSVNIFCILNVLSTAQKTTNINKKKIESKMTNVLLYS